MTTAAIAAIGTLFKRGDSATPENFTTIAELTSISGPELSLDVEDVTNHDSPGGYEEAIGTIIRTGSVTLEMNYQPAATTHKQLHTDLVAHTRRNYQLIFPDGLTTTWTLPCLVTGVTPEAPVEGKLSCSATFKVTGQPTLNA